jgi:hypothetical protein
MDRSVAPGSSTLAPVLMIAGAAASVPIDCVMPRFSPRASLHPIGPAADTGWTRACSRPSRTYATR